MNNLQLYQNDGLEIVINTRTGESFCSIRAFARMVDKVQGTVQHWIKVTNQEIKSQAIQTSRGVHFSHLLSEAQMIEGFKKWKPEVLDKFSQVGIRTYLHQLAGYQVTSSAVLKTEVSTFDLFQHAVKLFGEQNARLDALEKTVSHLTNDEEVFSLMAYFKAFYRRSFSSNLLAPIGRSVTAYCNQNEVIFETRKDARFGTINLYPRYVLDSYFETAKGADKLVKLGLDPGEYHDPEKPPSNVLQLFE
jgi:hypothetical protein